MFSVLTVIIIEGTDIQFPVYLPKHVLAKNVVSRSSTLRVDRQNVVTTHLLVLIFQI